MNWANVFAPGPYVPSTPTPPPLPEDDKPTAAELAEPDAAWLARRGWRSRLEDGGARRGYWIDLMAPLDVWLTLGEAVRLQTKVDAGTARWP